MEDNSLTFREWVAIFLGLGTVIVLSKVVGLSPKWEHAAEYTVLVFIVLVIVLRPAWRAPFFWRALTVAILIHALVIFFATQALPSDSLGIRGLPAILIGMVEGLFIANVLWRVTHRG